MIRVLDEERPDPSCGFVGGYEPETPSLGLPFMAAFLDPGAWRRGFTIARGRAVCEAVGATRALPTPPCPSAHNLGTNRMSQDPRLGVVNRWGQAHDVVGLFVLDGSRFTTGAAGNPMLTIVALAIRQAGHIAAGRL